MQALLSRINWRLFLSALGVVFLSEMGDKTQITTLLMAGEKPLYVFWIGLGSATALITTSFLEVIVGSQIIARFIKPVTIRRASSLIFIVLGILLLAGIMGNIGMQPS
jgi:Ca2+/H+ antiporter, TMEM165/GDT1 family